MPWGRVDDHHYRHEKVAELDEDLRKGCVALFWLAISWCNDRLTDGRVPRGTVRILGGDEAEADELVRVGLWEQDGSGYRVHDFLDFNKSKAQVESERVQRAAAGQAGAKARWHPDSDLPNEAANEVPNDAANDMNGGSDAPVTRLPSPVTPSPAPDARDDETPVLQWLGQHGCYLAPGSGYHRHLITAVTNHGAEAMVVALDRVSAAGVKNGDTKGLLFKAIDLLNEPHRPNVRDLARVERETQLSKQHVKGVERTKLRAHENGFHVEERDPLCPRCQGAAA